MIKNKYILITAAKNEEMLIEATILSVLNQTIKPIIWFIISDNSTDNTDEIIQKYASSNGFISYIRKNKDATRNFASKVFALNLAFNKLPETDYDFVGILDADITFDPTYYESMLNEFHNNKFLGIAGGEFYDILNNKKIRVMKSSDSVRGGIQLFRKDCFEEIGGFTPLKNGGEDILTEVLARKNGWIVKSFEHQMLKHHRLTGTGNLNIWHAKFRAGMLAYSVGYHPLFQILKSLHRIKERPYFISSILHMIGFVYAYLSGKKRVVSQDFIDYLRKEQLDRIRNFFI